MQLSADEQLPTLKAYASPEEVRKREEEAFRKRKEQEEKDRKAKKEAKDGKKAKKVCSEQRSPLCNRC